MVTIKIEISNTVKKVYDGGIFHGVKFVAQLIFGGLTAKDRVLLQLPVGEDTTEIVTISQLISPATDEAEIKRVLLNRMNKIKKQYEDKLVVTPDESVVLTADTNFKETLTKEK